MVEDRDILINWWESYDHMLVPNQELLPENGQSGLVIEKEGRDRFEMITMLIEACSELAIELGCRIIWAMTTYDGVVKRCKKLDHNVLDEKYNLIYTHHKAYENVVKKQKEGKANWLSLFKL